jgi:hypothetical protein
MSTQNVALTKHHETLSVAAMSWLVHRYRQDAA